jgi:hypothetical protein
VKGGSLPRPPSKQDPGEWKKGIENCCAYAYDRPGKQIQPGELGKVEPTYPETYTCNDLKKRVLADFPNDKNVNTVKKDGKCAGGYHKIQLWVAEAGQSGYHFTREDQDGNWSDMPLGHAAAVCKVNRSNETGVKSCDIFMCVPNRPL